MQIMLLLKFEVSIQISEGNCNIYAYILFSRLTRDLKRESKHVKNYYYTWYDGIIPKINFSKTKQSSNESFNCIFNYIHIKKEMILKHKIEAQQIIVQQHH